MYGLLSLSSLIYCLQRVADWTTTAGRGGDVQKGRGRSKAYDNIPYAGPHYKRSCERSHIPSIKMYGVDLYSIIFRILSEFQNNDFYLDNPLTLELQLVGFPRIYVYLATSAEGFRVTVPGSGVKHLKSLVGAAPIWTWVPGCDLVDIHINIPRGSSVAQSLQTLGQEIHVDEIPDEGYPGFELMVCKASRFDNILGFPGGGLTPLKISLSYRWMMPVIADLDRFVLSAISRWESPASWSPSI
jgi:hypothetical protein